ncbi:MAG: transposase, partial [Candidatus Acidiferrales bacterium]
RYYGKGHLHFITFSCYRRQPFLGTRRARDCFVRTLDWVRTRQGFRLAGYVVMPEHVHLLISEPKTGNPSKAVQVLKQKVSRTLRRRRRKIPHGQLQLAFRDSSPDAKHLWQRRFYDFNVWSWPKVREKLEYMHANPVKRKLVRHPKDWPWSSWSFYEGSGRGLICIDPFGEEKESKENAIPTKSKSQKPHP